MGGAAAAAEEYHYILSKIIVTNFQIYMNKKLE